MALLFFIDRKKTAAKSDETARRDCEPSETRPVMFPPYRNVLSQSRLSMGRAGKRAPTTTATTENGAKRGRFPPHDPPPGSDCESMVGPLCRGCCRTTLTAHGSEWPDAGRLCCRRVAALRSSRRSNDGASSPVMASVKRNGERTVVQIENKTPAAKKKHYLIKRKEQSCRVNESRICGKNLIAAHRNVSDGRAVTTMYGIQLAAVLDGILMIALVQLSDGRGHRERPLPSHQNESEHFVSCHAPCHHVLLPRVALFSNNELMDALERPYGRNRFQGRSPIPTGLNWMLFNLKLVTVEGFFADFDNTCAL